MAKKRIRWNTGDFKNYEPRPQFTDENEVDDAFDDDDQLGDSYEPGNHEWFKKRFFSIFSFISENG